MNRRRWLALCAAAVAVGGSAVWATRHVIGIWRRHMNGGATVSDRLAQYGEIVRERLAPDFARARCAWPPSSLTLLGLKRERRLEAYAPDRGGRWRLVRAYPILAASGGPGPKLREGDGQVPEGIYGVESLNPNSRFHLSVRIDYPNDVDRAQAVRDGRTDLGGDIMIHGSWVSVGCLAMGDDAAEDIFVLVALTGRENVRVLLAPCDLRHVAVDAASAGQPEWVRERYEQIRKAMASLPPTGARPD